MEFCGTQNIIYPYRAASVANVNAGRLNRRSNEMGTCPKCGERIDQVIGEIITIWKGAAEYVGTALRCPRDECAAILAIDTTSAVPED